MVGADAFVGRHVGPSEYDRRAMLERLGQRSVDALLDATVPASIRDDARLDLPAAGDEAEVLGRLRRIAADNDVRRSLIGTGYHGTVTPAVIRRNVLEDPGWYTAYTPYQPEISQGRLELLLVFQTMVADLTGCDLANASLLDEATAAAEGLQLCRRAARRDGAKVVLDPGCHPQTLAVVATRAEPLGLEVVVADLRDEAIRADVLAAPDEVAAVLLQQPTTDGRLHDDAALITALHDHDVPVVVATDLLACTVVTPPGEQGADVVVGSSQRFGVPPMAGGPHAGFLATREAWARQLPGRLVGVSKDDRGREAYRLALQTREQHIRRERATSNICTSQVLLAVVAALYAVHHGPDGLVRIAQRVHALTSVLVAQLRAAGLTVPTDRYFDTVTVRAPGRADALVGAAADAGFELRRVDADHLGISLDETVTVTEVATLVAALTGQDVDVAAEAEVLLDEASLTDALPTGLRRTSTFLTDPRFHTYRSETSLLRWLRRLKDRDIALDRAMIPLGSCTMKLNAAVEMEPITWPAFAEPHPFAPRERLAGTERIVADLERWLAEITGYDAVSLQPNAGSQGELAGLLAIRGYHRASGAAERDVCLIPSSAHGTNAASAVMAGMRVVVVACDDDGNVDVDDLAAKAEQHADRLAALMVTYPSTHGVFEPRIGEVCDLVHAHGGQVYLDGANLNALVGVAKPGRFGADVSHLNLHKTFCIPHGGGGPGVGPVACRSHLAPFLPSHPALAEEAASGTSGEGPPTGPVAAAPWGSAGILPISWAYVALMGPDGLRRATETAILSANYVAHRLRDHFPVLYAGASGLVAHEVIIDLRDLQRRTGISNEDVAKRLIDLGFHAPTMSFPVAGTLMIEPTESESKAELDRFCDAMIRIREEIDAVADGTWPADDNPLVNAPHVLEDVLAEAWSHAYGRDVAAFPVDGLRRDRYWPPVGRIDQAHGDRNLQCACPPPEAFATSMD
ncbi:aminomethyl-transferring glycine dehydrogenase [Nitriliruptoraceae bacterium ZYF776]|nr:aminomethyl-transferring glycine dehydrogenase [Profundirhabdus halotolerans]